MNVKKETKIIYPKCPICGMDEELPHTSCKINCFECSKPIPSLDFYYHNDKEFFRFCSEECQKIFIDKVANKLVD